MKIFEAFFTMPRTSLYSPICAAASEEVLSLNKQMNYLEGTLLYCHKQECLSNFASKAGKCCVSNGIKSFMRNLRIAIFTHSKMVSSCPNKVEPAHGNGINYIAFSPTYSLEFSRFYNFIRHINFYVMLLNRSRFGSAERDYNTKPLVTPWFRGDDNNGSAFNHFGHNEASIIAHDNLSRMRGNFKRHGLVLPKPSQIASGATA